MSSLSLADKITSMPKAPGVYQMLDAEGKVLYVGKAASLRARVSSYFGNRGLATRTLALVSRITDIDITRTRSETEALLLEQSLIKSEKPPFNVMMRDDKMYPYLHLSEHGFPRLRIFRGRKKPAGKLYGPYPNVTSLNKAMDLLQKEFHLRTCDDSYFRNRTRPCLKYQIGRCSAPCTGEITAEEYAQDLAHTDMLLKGRSDEMVVQLQGNMDEASAQLDFERAAHHRDRIAALRRLQQEQSIYTGRGDVDVLGLALGATRAHLHCMNMRGGQVVHTQNHNLGVGKSEREEVREEEVLEAFISHHYLSDSSRSVPREIICHLPPQNADLLQRLLNKARGSQVHIRQRVRGHRATLLQLARDNARLAMQQHQSRQADTVQRFQALQEFLKLEQLPKFIECFDISHTSGTETYAAAVAFSHAGPLKEDYRRYRIKTAQPGDDYAALAEAVERHLARCSERARWPDLILIDGGKGQVAAVRELVQQTGRDILLMGIAKGAARKPGQEVLILPERELVLPRHHQALLLLQQVRDEAHRFAVSGHRSARTRKQTRSQLQEIPGIGPARRRALLRYFGGVQALQKASLKEIARVAGIGEKHATTVYNAMHSK